MKTDKVFQKIFTYGGIILLTAVVLTAIIYVTGSYFTFTDIAKGLSEGKNPAEVSISLKNAANWMITVLVCAVLALTYSFFFAARIAKKQSNDKKRSFDAIKAGNLVLLSVNKYGTVIYANSNLLDATGYESHELLGKKIDLLINPSAEEIFLKDFGEMLKEPSVCRYIIPLQRRDGTEIHYLWSSNPIQNETGSTIVEMLGVNISLLRNRQEKIHKLAYYDNLTGLPNVIFFEEHTDSLIKCNTEFAVLYIDLDNFKYINDTYGRGVGDKLLYEICCELNKNQTGKEFISRCGGDEIIIAYRNYANPNEVAEYSSFVLNKIKQEYEVNGMTINTSGSIGISFFPEDGSTFAELYKASVVSMNKAKELGKTRAVFYSQAIKEEVNSTQLLEDELKEAVKNNEFILYYQPQYHIRTGDIYGFEALIRWISPNRGNVQPGVFIPALEKSQLVVPVGYKVMEEAAEFSKKIESMGYSNLRVSINVSAVQLTRDDFVEKTIEILKASGVNLKNIRLEITESVMFDFAESNIEKMHLLTKSGITIALDDFGTGYSPLTYLKKLPMGLLKIDKTLTDEIVDDKENREIVSSIIDLAHSINIEVVAEGVEYEEQLNWLRNKGCNICQGYYSGKPAPMNEAFKFLTKNIYRDR